MVFTVILFLKHVREQRDSFLQTINNHLSHVDESTAENTTMLTKLNGAIENLTQFLNRNGGK